MTAKQSDKLEPMCDDGEAMYDAEISPLMTKIIGICEKHRIPMLAAFQYAPDDWRVTAISFAGMSHRLKMAMDVVFAGLVAVTPSEGE